MNQFPPSPWVYQLGRFEFFRKFAKIFAAQGAPQVSLTPVANGKNLQIIKVLIILFGHLWNVDTTYKYIFAFKLTLEVSAAWYCSYYLQPLSTTLAKPVAKFAAGVVDTDGKFATGVVYTSGAPWLANISANFQKNFKQS
jgi:hypothetical protein